MAKLKSTLPNMLLSLTIICVVAGALLAWVNTMTEGPIALSKATALEAAVKAVVPEFDNSPIEEAEKIETPDGATLTIYPAKKNGSKVGAAVESYSMNGFSGEIKIIVGFDNDGRIINYSILQHAETPGLGSKMADWFKTDKNNQSIIGLSPINSLKVTKDNGQVDAITASTITSRAFLEAVNRAYSAYAGIDAPTSATEQVDAETGATEQVDGETGATETEEGGEL